MNNIKKIIPIIVSITLFALNFSLQAKSLKALTTEFAKAMQKRNINRIAILEVRAKKEISEDAIKAREYLTQAFVAQKKITVLDRNSLDKILLENELNQSGIIKKEDNINIGKLLKVEALLSSTLVASEGSLEMNVQLIETSSGRIIAADSVNLNVNNPSTTIQNSNKPSIQVAILLDTSNSMDGLINQARSQVWNIVNQLANAERKGQNPDIEVALYEYGNDNISIDAGYTRQVLGFTKDLNKFSEALFSLTTRGGQEYAGRVIQESISGLLWKKGDHVYRTVFIAGNESFEQGSINFRIPIKKAKSMGIYVNTIFCGPASQGIAFKWKAGAQAGGGDYSNINQANRVIAIKAPQDNEIEKLGRKLNTTNIPYGSRGQKESKVEAAQDTNATNMSASGASIQRQIFKSKRQYYSSNTWDLVSMIDNKKMKVKDIKKKNLPKKLRKMSPKQLKKYIKKKISERQAIRERITKLSKKRQRYVQEERKKTSEAETLDEALMNSIKKQATKQDFSF